MQAFQSRALFPVRPPLWISSKTFSVSIARRTSPFEDLHAFEQELHRFFVAAEREALGHELAHFDLDVPAVEWTGSGTIASCGVPQPTPVP